MFAATGLRQTQMLVAIGAFAIMMLIVFTMSALFSAGPGNGAKPSPALSEDASTVMLASIKALPSPALMVAFDAKISDRGASHR